jgi:hypothetical protein
MDPARPIRRSWGENGEARAYKGGKHAGDGSDLAPSRRALPPRAYILGTVKRTTYQCPVWRGAAARGR